MAPPPPPPPLPFPNCSPFYGQYPYPGYAMPPPQQQQQQPTAFPADLNEPAEGIAVGGTEAMPEEEEEGEEADGCPGVFSADGGEYVTVSMRGVFWKLLIAAGVAFPLSTLGAVYLLLTRQQPGAAVEASVDFLSGGPSSSITWRDIGAIWMVCCIASKLLRLVTGGLGSAMDA